MDLALPLIPTYVFAQQALQHVGIYEPGIVLATSDAKTSAGINSSPKFLQPEMRKQLPQIWAAMAPCSP